MAYQIVTAIPHFNDRDAICGWSYDRDPNAYETAALAFKLCSIRSDGMDETASYVVNWGGDIQKDRVWNFSKDPATIAACEVLDNWF